jgi:DNA-binding MarR family transcriptional regulator
MENVKEAFAKVKQDMDFLKEEISILREDLTETRKGLIEVCEILREYSNKIEEKKEKEKKEEQKPLSKEEVNPAHDFLNQTIPTDNPTHNLLQNPLNTQIMGISTGNRGVPTDRQTDRQTDQQMNKGSYNTINSIKEDSINDAVQILESLDNLKKEIRLKFKRLTEQELLVFSTLYQSSEEEGHTDYKNLSERLKLTESSIRDYIGRLIKKGIPVEKVKINNKTIHLSISPNLKRIASLSTILQLRSI